MSRSARRKPISRKRRGRSPTDEEAQDRALFELDTIGVMQVDPATGRYLRVNSRFCEMVGYSAAALLKMTMRDLTHPEDRDKDWRKFLRARRGETRDYRTEKRYLRKDGESVWVRVNASIIRDQKGHPIRTLGVVEDITASKRAEADLTENRLRLAAIFDSALDAIITVDDRQRIVFFNGAAERIFDRPASAALGMPLRRLWPGRSHTEYTRFRRRLGQEPQETPSPPRVLPLIAQRSNGKTFPAEISLSEVEVNDRRLVTILVRDITNRVRAAQKMNALQQFTEETAVLLDALQSHVPVGIAFISPDYRYLRINDELAAMHGLPPAAHIGKRVQEIVPELWPQVEPIFERVLKERRPVVDVEIIGPGRGGSPRERHCLASYHPIQMSHDGKLTGIGIVVDDITERRQLEREVIEVSHREQQRIGQDLHDDLCQWLTASELLSSALAKNVAAESPANAALAAKVGHNLRHALARARNLARGLTPGVAVTAGLDAALKQLARTAAEMFEIRCTCESDGTIKVRDENKILQLYRIAQEAITNSVRHGGAREVFLDVQADGDHAAVLIRDDGCGIAEPLPERTGLGLRTMRYRAARIDATLDIRRAAKGGTEVVCTFPLQP